MSGSVLTTLIASASSSGSTPLRTLILSTSPFSRYTKSHNYPSLYIIAFCCFRIFCILANVRQKSTVTTGEHWHFFNNNKWYLRLKSSFDSGFNRRRRWRWRWRRSNFCLNVATFFFAAHEEKANRTSKIAGKIRNSFRFAMKLEIVFSFHNRFLFG